MNDFIKKLGWAEGLEISDLKRVLPWTYRDVLLKNGGKDIYIVWGKKPWVMKRCWNNDITSKSYFIFDIDIRDNHMKLNDWKILSEIELERRIKLLMYLLEKDRYLAEWSYIINSGNWIHIYYCWRPIIVWTDISSEEYSRGVQKIYDIFITYMESRMKVINQDLRDLYPDYMCSNIARTTRLPLSYNCKKKYWLPALKVKIYAYQKTDSRLLSMLPQLWKEEVKLKPRYKKYKKTSWYKKIEVGNFKILDVIQKYTGKNFSKWLWSCPFPWHKDKKPSFSVKVKENYFNCFAWCWWGNPANFIAKMENIPYWEAIKRLDQNFKY